MTKKATALLVSLTCGLMLAIILLQSLSAPAAVTYAQNANNPPSTTVAQPNQSASALSPTSALIAAGAGPYSDLTVDQQGRLHASYNNVGSTLLYHAVFSDGQWLTETIDSGPRLRRNSIAIDETTGQPVVAYEQDYGLNHAYLDNGAWSTETLASGSPKINHKHVDVAVDSMGQSHIAFSQASAALAGTYGLAAGYQVADFEDLTNQELNGDGTNWLDQQGIPSIAVLLTDYLTTDWQENLAGMQAVLAAHAD